MNNKKLMLGNEAVARGLYEAGCTIVSSYPGTPSTEITECVSGYSEIYSEWGVNEKVSCEVAIGASIGGARAFTAMKHVGLNVAADPLFTASYTGVNGGLVIAVADDPGMHSSQNEQDSRHYAIASKVPMLEPSNSMECKEYTKLAFELSEKFDTPVILRLSTRVSHSQSIVELFDRTEQPLKEYKKDIAKYVMMPAMARPKHVMVENRTVALAEYGETEAINSVDLNDTKIGVITSGVSYQYAKEALGNSVSYLKLGMVNPMPVNLIKDFASKVDEVIVIEELDDIIETHCKKIGVAVKGKEIFTLLGEYSQKLIREKMQGIVPQSVALEETLPVRPPVMCAGCPHRGVFYLLSKLKLMVNGDIGCYTLGAAPPLAAIDTTVCMGYSVSGIHGFNKARGPESAKKSVAVIGDSTFMHSGITGLIDIVYNQGNSTVIIMDNSTTGMTGQQENPTTGKTITGEVASQINIEKLCEAVGVKHITVVDPNNLAATEKAIKEALENDQPSVVITRRPCALLKCVVHEPSFTINPDTCVGCKACLKIGCPAISMNGKKAVINTSLCVGCDLCTQMCKFGCITKGNGGVN